MEPGVAGPHPGGTDGRRQQADAPRRRLRGVALRVLAAAVAVLVGCELVARIVVTPPYRRLEAVAAALRGQGVESYFLGSIFAGISETVYSDDCCHLNERGLEILNRRIAERILGSGRLDEIPPAT